MSISIIRQIHVINCYIASIISITVNSLLLYLIIKHTNKELKAYSRILLMTCIIDMFQAIIILLFKPVSCSIHISFISSILLFLLFLPFLPFFRFLPFMFFRKSNLLMEHIILLSIAFFQ